MHSSSSWRFLHFIWWIENTWCVFEKMWTPTRAVCSFAISNQYLFTYWSKFNIRFNNVVFCFSSQLCMFYLLRTLYYLHIYVDSCLLNYGFYFSPNKSLKKLIVNILASSDSKCLRKICLESFKTSQYISLSALCLKNPEKALCKMSRGTVAIFLNFKPYLNKKKQNY